MDFEDKGVTLGREPHPGPVMGGSSLVTSGRKVRQAVRGEGGRQK